ncbi:DUF7283 family protein [Halomarina rubra]|uniref:Uncharacterized protein n=1 Tax=Halomarina rubra TaxID=2071873 RepID=A0ABD6AVW1_9EURY|nr:hypothetical protein [Halomarina rubra]
MDTEAPADTLPVWVGLAVASAALCGVALGLPTGTPDASTVARTVDEAASSPHDATTTTRLSAADRLELGRHALDRCRGDACGHATFTYGPVTPVGDGESLARVLAGRSPASVFDSPATFRRAVERAREDAPVVVDGATRLTARHVTWGGVDVTLVGA